MRSLEWSDNTCRVGWTSVWGILTYEDMLWLREQDPRGFFTPTRYFLPELWPYSWKTQQGMLYNMESKPEYETGFYFTFPENNTTLLVELRLMGMKPKRAKS